MESPTEAMFAGIAGYEDVKEELLELVRWYKDEKLASDPNVALPKGILFYGPSGTGKSAFAKRLIDIFGWPSFTIDGEKANGIIEETLKKAKACERSVIFIDEIDLLLHEDYEAVRAIRSAMDEDDGVLYLATTNHLARIDRALRRDGRFDRAIPVGFPSGDDVKDIYRFYLRKFGMDLGCLDGMTPESLAFCCEGTTGAGIRAIVNDCYLRKGKEAKSEDLLASYSRIEEETVHPVKASDRTLPVAIHEAGHIACVIAQKGLVFRRAMFAGGYSKGRTLADDSKDERYRDTQELRFQHIVVCYGGYYAEQIVGKKLFGASILGEGVEHDLTDARHFAANLVNRLGYAGADYTLPLLDNERMESGFTKIRNERQWRKVLRRAARKAKRIVAKEKDTIIALAKLMMEKGEIVPEDIRALKGDAKKKGENTYVESKSPVCVPSA